MQKNKFFFRVFLLLAVTGCTANRALDDRYHFDSQEKSAFERVLLETRERLPSKIRNELPADISYALADLNPLPEKPCDANNHEARIKFGSFNRWTHRLVMDYRIARKLIDHDQTTIDCVHATWERFAEATLIHEWIHAWDSKQHLSDDPAFRKLVYWESGLFGAYQMNTHPQRSPDVYEYKNPRESLAINMEYFLLDSDYACRRPVLHAFFVSIFGESGLKRDMRECGSEIMAHNAELAMLKSIDPARIYRIDYMLAATGDTAVSSFGHSMYRIVVCAPGHLSVITGAYVDATPWGEACLKDETFHLVVSFRANVDDLVLDYWKGVAGGYLSRPFILPYLQVREEYTGDQLRDITLYPLQLTPPQRAAFIQSAITQFWEYSGDYLFVTRNCAVESLHLLQASLPYHPLHQFHILSPIGLRDAFYETGLVNRDDPDILHIQSRRHQLQHWLHIAYPEWEQGDSEAALMHYLRETTARERRVQFSADSVSRMAAQLLLERQIKRMKTRELGLLAKKALYQQYLASETGQDIQDLLFPLQSEALQLKGYGIPYRDEIFYDEAKQQQKIHQLKQALISWLKVNEPALWQEYTEIDTNIGQLDILGIKHGG